VLSVVSTQSTWGGYSGDTSEQFVVGPEFCGGALSKGGNVIADNSDSTGGLVSSNIFLVQAIAGGITLDTAIADDDDAVQYSANAPITGFSIRYYQSPCTGPTQS